MNKRISSLGIGLSFFIVIFSFGINPAHSEESFDISLKRGNNLVSLPLTPQNTDIQQVLAPIMNAIKDVWMFDSSAPDSPWKHYRPGLEDYSDFDRINSGLGYWIDLKYKATLRIRGEPVSEGAILRLNKGWNIIGWPYQDSQNITEAFSALVFGVDYTQVSRFNNVAKTQENFLNQPNDDFTTFDAGKAYYIYMLKDRTIGIGVAVPESPQTPVSTLGEGRVTLNWNEVFSNIAGYNVYRSENPSGPYLKINSELITTNTYIDHTVEQGVQYYYVITAVDIYGNESSYSVVISRFLGTFIGAEGGEVVSSDGKVRLIIPAGALSEPTPITILSPRENSLQGLTPDGHLLLRAAEFKPYYFIFNKLVEVIYTLNSAEVPGTAVVLGFYDPVEDKIIPTGQHSIVATDGYTVSFKIDHFSTYAALKSLTSQGAPIGSGVQIPLPDMFTGAFSHSIPITVTPGRKKMQPNLALTYRSSNPNSWVGVGFGLNPGYIARSTRLGPPSYVDTEDNFYFVSAAGSTELVHLTDNLYQAKIESNFAKFFKEADDSWRIVQKDGMVLRFGQTSDSKETSPQGTFAWYVTKVVDTNANYLEYNYTKDEGKSYLNYIDYTGNQDVGVSPVNRVEFSLESRDDVSSTYISGAMISTAKRLSQIQVKQNGDLVWRYELGYEYSPDTNRSLLKTITQYGADGSSFPTQTFSYQSSN